MSVEGLITNKHEQHYITTKRILHEREIGLAYGCESHLCFSTGDRYNKEAWHKQRPNPNRLHTAY